MTSSHCSKKKKKKSHDWFGENKRNFRTHLVYCNDDYTYCNYGIFFTRPTNPLNAFDMSLASLINVV